MIDDLVSIIIPVYNSEKYLDACLQSVLAQTYKNIEVLLIDDGSTDRSGVICDAYAVMDSRIQVLHNVNHGVSYSRNCGIDKAHGEFIIFIDSDDCINNKYIEELMRFKGRYDLVIGQVVHIYENKGYNIKVPILSKKGILSQDYGNIKSFLQFPHSKLYRKNLIKENGIFFPNNINWGEDRIFNWKYYQHISSYGFSSEAQYYYFHRNNGSLSKQPRKMDDSQFYEKIWDAYDCFLERQNIRDKYKLLCDMCIDDAIYAGGGYCSFCKRCKLIKNYIGKRYSSSNWKRWLVLKCIQHGWYKIIYIYYRLKWIRQRWRN